MTQPNSMWNVFKPNIHWCITTTAVMDTKHMHPQLPKIENVTSWNIYGVKVSSLKVKGDTGYVWILPRQFSAATQLCVEFLRCMQMNVFRLQVSVFLQHHWHPWYCSVTGIPDVAASLESLIFIFSSSHFEWMSVLGTSNNMTVYCMVEIILHHWISVMTLL